jgi:hypothetical protein
MPYEKNQFVVEWVDGGRKPTAPSNPKYPNGLDVEAFVPGQTTCYLKLAYPAKQCGVYHIRCRVCHLTAVVTTAGRRDDPRSIKLACKIEGNEPKGSQL